MRVIIDRFEGNYAVCEKEDKTMVDIKKDKLPSRARPGDVLLVKENKFYIDENETEKRKERIENLMKDMWE